MATILGSGMVFFFKNKISEKIQRVFLGFAAGIMIAASVWSLLIPAIEMTDKSTAQTLLSVGGGFIFGCAFLMILDKIIPHMHIDSNTPEGIPSHLKKSTMIFIAVTLHNIPEGMAVGLSFSNAASPESGGTLAAATALAIGMGLQNFPEGAAISLPLRANGASKIKAFTYGALSGIVEPVFGILTVLIASNISFAMPAILSFAAGAMIYVVIEELLPEAHLGEHSHSGTISVISGFVLMMLLDILLG